MLCSLLVSLGGKNVVVLFTKPKAMLIFGKPYGNTKVRKVNMEEPFFRPYIHSGTLLGKKLRREYHQQTYSSFKIDSYDIWKTNLPRILRKTHHKSSLFQKKSIVAYSRKRITKLNQVPRR